MSTRQGKSTLGIKHDNPGNIRFVEGVVWRGQSETPYNGFVVFIDVIYGIRAMQRALLVMYHQEGFHTIEQLITRWAPPSENNTPAYIKAVSTSTNIPSLATLVMPADLILLCKAIITHENGYQPYPDIMFQDAFNLLKEAGKAYV